MDPKAAARLAIDTTANTLNRSTDVDSCVALAGKLDRHLDATLAYARQSLGAPIACRAGCSYCCHVRVDVLAHEAIALVRYLKSQIPEEQARAIAARVAANADRLATMTPDQHNAARVQCAFLVSGRCSVYPVRPLACAGFHSLDVGKCERAYNDPADLTDPIPMVGEVKEIETATAAGVRQALRGLKLDDQPMELHTAVAALLREPGLIGRWRAGRSLLKKVRPGNR
jgi:Fe-S-cluster containining protein